MPNLTGNLFKYNMVNVYFTTGTPIFKAALMATGFAFSRTAHRKYSDIAASQFGSGTGYTTGGQALTGIAVTEDDTLQKVTVTWTNPTWTASGGPIGPCAGCLVYNDSASDKDIVLYIPFSPEQTQGDGGVFTVANVEYDNVDTATAI